jgi:hypothetical protein
VINGSSFFDTFHLLSDFRVTINVAKRFIRHPNGRFGASTMPWVRYSQGYFDSLEVCEEHPKDHEVDENGCCG